MNPWKRIVARRQRKAHERYLAERAREQALQGEDAQDAVRKVAEGSAGMQGYTKVAIDVTKQLLTLASAVLALTLTVAKAAPNGTRGLMLAGWAAFLLSVIFGITSLYALIREFAPRSDGGDAAPSIGSLRVRGPLLLQIVTFALGAVFVVAYGYSVWKNL